MIKNYQQNKITLSEHNSSVKHSSEIMSGKEFRRLKRKKIKKSTIKFGGY